MIETNGTHPYLTSTRRRRQGNNQAKASRTRIFFYDQAAARYTRIFSYHTVPSLIDNKEGFICNPSPVSKVVYNVISRGEDSTKGRGGPNVATNILNELSQETPSTSPSILISPRTPQDKRQPTYSITPGSSCNGKRSWNE